MIGFRNKYIIGFFAALGLLVYGCVEPYEFQSETFDSAVVVEGTITNEEKSQEIMISRTYRLEEDGPVPLRNAEVMVEDDAGGIFAFEERSPGKYFSVNHFKAEEGRSYQLKFTTGSGENYASDPAQFSGTTVIEDVYAQPGENIEGDPGIEILVNSRGTAGSSGYYRYEYEETYKIVSPFYKTQDLVLDEDGNVALVPKSKEEYICFNTELSQNIVISNTNLLYEDNVEGELLRFIRRKNPVLAHRYSMLVKQYGISREAYSFYQSLKDLSESKSLFSQIQPGYLAGNLYSLDNPDENVLGFFSVSSVTEKRMYFNYTDFYDITEGPRPTFTSYCPFYNASSESELLDLVRNDGLKYYIDRFPLVQGPGRYVFVWAECVDCTLVGSNVVPEFWEE